MKIRYYATLRDITGVEEAEWHSSAPTVGALVEDLCVHYGPRFRRWMKEGAKMAPWVIVMVNGRDYRHLQGVDTPLSPTDTITLFPPVAGG
jgi:molybdopterin synthase sulfur carrier subunit